MAHVAAEQVTHWGDSVAVFLISNVHSPDEKATVHRWVKGSGRTEVAAPSCVPTYVQYMRGVHAMDGHQRCAFEPGQYDAHC